jgi:pantothenate kinase-related protein Tda10
MSTKNNYNKRVVQFRRIMERLDKPILFFTTEEGDTQYQRYRKQCTRKFRAQRAWRRLLPGLR